MSHEVSAALSTHGYLLFVIYFYFYDPCSLSLIIVVSSLWIDGEGRACEGCGFMGSFRSLGWFRVVLESMCWRWEGSSPLTKFHSYARSRFTVFWMHELGGLFALHKLSCFCWFKVYCGYFTEKRCSFICEAKHFLHSFGLLVWLSCCKSARSRIN